MTLNTQNLLRTIDILQEALNAIRLHNKNDIIFDLYRNAAIKSFELSLETAGKLLRKALKGYFSNPSNVDKLVFNDVLRYANKHGLLDNESVERWFLYRANRNSTAHDYGEDFANETLKILPIFVQDVRILVVKIQEAFDAGISDK